MILQNDVPQRLLGDMRRKKENSYSCKNTYRKKFYCKDRHKLYYLLCVIVIFYIYLPIILARRNKKTIQIHFFSNRNDCNSKKRHIFAVLLSSRASEYWRFRVKALNMLLEFSASIAIILCRSTELDIVAPRAAWPTGSPRSEH